LDRAVAAVRDARDTPALAGNVRDMLEGRRSRLS
jgi:hypothetical protein